MYMKVQKPLRGHKHRTRSFQEYLLEQPPERRAEILAAEHQFNLDRNAPGSATLQAIVQYNEDLTLAIAREIPAGAKRKNRRILFLKFEELNLEIDYLPFL